MSAVAQFLDKISRQVVAHDKIQAELTRGVVKAEKKIKALEVGRLKNQEHRVLEGSSKWRRVSLRIVKQDAERKIQSKS